LIPCDGLHTDPENGKTTILGVLDSVASSAFPFEHAGVCVYAELTDGRGATPITVRLVDADEETILMSGDGIARFENPRQMVVFMIRAQVVTFPAPGTYYVQILARERVIMERRISVRRKVE
jgi:hypothetical protein